MKKKRPPLADKLKRARKAVGLSQRELGKMLKLSDKAVSSYEVGRAAPSLEVLKKIGELTHKPIQYFMDEELSTEVNIQGKIKVIESELAAIKQILLKRKNN